jgi:hypothetical protein
MQSSFLIKFKLDLEESQNLKEMVLWSLISVPVENVCLTFFCNNRIYQTASPKYDWRVLLWADNVRSEFESLFQLLLSQS